jgi:hypothetical protein
VGALKGVQEVLALNAEDLTPPQAHQRTSGVRYFAIPFTEENFPGDVLPETVEIVVNVSK